MSTTMIPIARNDKPSWTVVQPRARHFRAAVLDALSLWLARRRERDALADLAEDGHLLRDVGLTREQALHEAGKPCWR